MKKRDLIYYCGASGIFIVVILLLIYLANNSVPAENKDIFVSITGMIVGSYTLNYLNLIAQMKKVLVSIWMNLS